MGRIQGLAELYFVGDTLVKSADGYLFSITLAWSGGAAGNKVVLRDGTDASGVPLAVFVENAASGTYVKEWSNGKRFANGLFIDVQGGGNVEGEITYK